MCCWAKKARRSSADDNYVRNKYECGTIGSFNDVGTTFDARHGGLQRTGKDSKGEETKRGMVSINEDDGSFHVYTQEFYDVHVFLLPLTAHTGAELTRIVVFFHRLQRSQLTARGLITDCSEPAGLVAVDLYNDCIPRRKCLWKRYDLSPCFAL